jgi:hypothetical protein
VIGNEKTFAWRAVDRTRGTSAPGVESASLFVIVTPYRIRGQSDLRWIFERRMEERQAYLDHSYVFDTPRLPPLHVDRKSKGLLAVIRLAQQASPSSSHSPPVAEQP